MKDSTVKAYARAFAALTRALVDKGVRVSLPDEIDKCSAHPVDGLTPLFIKATRESALDARTNELIQTFLNAADPDDELHNKRPLPQHQQGIWLLEYEHWKEYMTPAEAAEKLGVTKQRVSALIKNDQLEAVKAGRNWYISSLSVDMRVDGHVS